MTTFNKLQKYSTFLEGLQYSLVYAGLYNRSDMVVPAAILENQRGRVFILDRLTKRRKGQIFILDRSNWQGEE